MRTQGQSAETIRRRTGTIRRIERQLRTDADTLGVDQINAWLARYTGASTRAAYFGDIAAYFEWLQFTGQIDAAPTDRIRRPRQPKRYPRPITTTQLDAALETATGDVLAWILLGAYQGLRVSEAAAVAGQHVGAGQLRVLGKGDSDKTIPLNELLAEVAAGRPVRGWWFPGRYAGTHITAHTVSELTIAHFESVGVRDFTFHRLRHWCGTEMLRAGADLRQVQVFLRHESITSTEGYTQVVQDDLRAAAARLPRTGAGARSASRRLAS
jgi:integrase/recombinase XerD